MIRWSIIFLIVALIAAVLGFGTVANAAANIAKVFFFIFIVLFAITLIAGGLLVRKVKKKISNVLNK